MSHRFYFASSVFTLSLVMSVAVNAPLSAAGDTWSPADNMTVARSGACAALLQDGRVLITGGEGGSGVLTSAELLSTAGKFSGAASMAFPRARHSCATLPDGRVLVAGGSTKGGAATNAAEVYDASTGSWLITSPMISARAGATASLLKDGRVLIAGGESAGEAILTLEIYDPSSGRFLPVWRPLSSPRKDHAAAVLKDGRVVIAGGSNGSRPLDSVDIFDPVTSEISAIGRMSTPRAGLTATALLDGRVFLAGGDNGSGDLASTELFDPATGTFLPAAVMDTPRRGHVALRIPNNNSVLIVGGASAGAPTAAAGLYIPWTNSYRPSAPLSLGRTGVAATALREKGALMLAGGSTRDATTQTVEVTSVPTILTAKTDYEPGEVVLITGANWTPGATVSLRVTRVADNSVRWGPADVIADGTGNITAQFTVTDADLGLTFALTATEPMSGKTAQVWTFTDASLAYSPDSQVLTAAAGGSAVSFTQSVTAPKGSGSFTAELHLAATGSNPIASTWVTTSPKQLQFTTTAGAGDTKSWTVSFAVPAGTAAGNYTAQIKANPSVSGVGEDSGTAVTLTVTSDSTPPVITPTVSGTLGLNGWYTSNVNVSWTVNDLESAVTSTSGCGTTTISTDTTGTTLTCSATSSGGTSSNSVTIKRDATPPTASASALPAANANGWNNTDVTVTFTGTDTGSGIDFCTPAVTLTGEGAGQTAGPGTCTDKAGNVSAPVSKTGINIDKTPPTASAVASPAANANGWNNTDVTVTFTGTDTGSGIDFCTPQITLTGEGTGQTAGSGTCTDKAGNVSASVSKTGINIDKTAPTLNFNPATPAANLAGWNNTNVSIAFTAFDNLSGVASTNPGSSPLILISEGNAVTGTVTVVDKAGNAATFTSPMFKIDKTPPLLTASATPAANANGWNNADVTVGFVCTDGLSGIATMPVSPQIVNTEGANQFRAATCSDVAGNGAAATVGPINLDKTPPVTSNVVVLPVPLDVAATVRADLTALPPPGSKVVAAEYRIDGGPYSPMVGSLPGETVTVSATVAGYSTVGVHEVCVRGKDIADNVGADGCALLAVYDPSAGFVTGGGWINSPAGAYAANATVTGKANFGFVSKYKKGQSIPDGNTEFQFQAAGFNFHSTSYDWLVIAGPKAQYKGSGAIGGAGDYGFILTAIDGSINGGGGVDKFRLKVWDKTTGAVIYDNQLGASDTSDPTTALGGGSIVIHNN